jgi:hypothetical protein
MRRLIEILSSIFFDDRGQLNDGVGRGALLGSKIRMSVWLEF